MLPRYVFLRVFLQSGRDPWVLQEIDSYVFYRVFLACGPLHTCFHVSAVVAAPFDGIWRPFPALLFLAFWLPFGRIIRENTCRERSGRKWPQYRELRSLEAESIRSLAPLREVGLARRGAARRSAADPGRFALPPRCLNSAEIHGEARQTRRMLEYME